MVHGSKSVLISVVPVVKRVSCDKYIFIGFCLNQNIDETNTESNYNLHTSGHAGSYRNEAMSILSSFCNMDAKLQSKRINFSTLS